MRLILAFALACGFGSVANADALACKLIKAPNGAQTYDVTPCKFSDAPTREGGKLSLPGVAITSINTIPAGADVTIAGTEIGVTPIMFIIEPVGDRSKAFDATIELKGYDTIHGEVRDGDSFRLTLKAATQSSP